MSQKENSSSNAISLEVFHCQSEDEVVQTLKARDYKDPQCVAYRKTGHPQNSEQGQGWQETEVNDTLNAFDSGEMRSPTLATQVFDGSRRHDYQPFGEVGETVQAQYGTGGNNTPIVVESAKTIFGQEIAGTLVSSMTTPVGSTQDKNVIITSSWDGSQLSPTLTKNNAGGEQRMPDKDNFNAVIEQDSTQSVVRRLTPKECERLQGFPDDWTNIGEWVDSKGKKHKDADSPRYKALGNSIALPFWEWLIIRIGKQLKKDGVKHPKMASLFDGIGGFPLVSQRNGIEPVWASEIEEFPIAVTKRHFPERGEDEDKGINNTISGSSDSETGNDTIPGSS